MIYYVNFGGIFSEKCQFNMCHTLHTIGSRLKSNNDKKIFWPLLLLQFVHILGVFLLISPSLLCTPVIDSLFHRDFILYLKIKKKKLWFEVIDFYVLKKTIDAIVINLK
jgi:hypothetical protein